MTIDPTGRQIRLRRTGSLGEVTAHIAQLGASLRGLTVDGVELMPPYPEGAPTPSASGIVLVPWPNRVRDGVWTQSGKTLALAITEPARGNAIHGLLRYFPYDIEEGEGSATLRAPIFPQTGYPYALQTAVTYALTDSGVEVTHEIVNVGTETAPVALGTHPFLTVGGADPADLVLRSPAASYVEVDPERMLPLGIRPVDDRTDLREGRRLGDLSLDTAYGDLTRDPDGLVRHTLTAPDGRVTTLWQGEGFDHSQVFVTDGYPGRPLAVAVEPMTATVDAFNSGEGLRRLAAGERWRLHWGIDYTP